MTYAYWSHESGETYVIRFDDDGDINAVCGPLHYSERGKSAYAYEFETEDVEWVIDHSGEFRDTTTIAEADALHA